MNACLRPMSTTAALFAAWLMTIAATTPACADLQVVEEETDEGQRTIYKMTVSPAAEPVPALKHRLTLRELEFRPGNAATHYARAFPEGGIEATWRMLTKKFGDEEVHSWYDLEVPLDKLPLDKVREAANSFGTLVDVHVKTASERRDCDWGHGIISEMRGPDIYAFLLPEIQAMRSISRALMLPTRVAIVDRDYERAINLLRMNYRMGGHVAQSPFLVSGLVGIAICGLVNAELVELIAAEDSPNLYWAIAELPRPLVNLRTSARYELSLHTQVFPFLEDAETARHSPDEWARILGEGLRSSQSLIDASPRFNEFSSQAAIAGLAVITYADAKQRLVDSGLEAAQVQQMPVGQVIAIDAAREYRRMADEFEKWWYVPYRIAKVGASDADDELEAGGKFEGGYGRVLARLLLPAMQAARGAEARLGWQLNGIQTVEAIRMHAAETGKLPNSLEEIEVVPVPDNPITEKPYDYRLDGDTAVLDLPFSDGFAGVAWRYEITLAK